MATSNQARRAKSLLRFSPYAAAIAAAAAVVLGFYAPPLPLFLFVAAILGALLFALDWVGIHLRKDMAWISTVLIVLTHGICSRSLMPRGTVTATDRALLAVQFFAVLLLVFSVLYVVFRQQMKRHLAEDAA